MKAICNYKFSDWTQYANLQACFKEADAMHGAVRLISNWSTGSQPAPGGGAGQPQAPVTYAETTGGQTHTWTNPANAGGNAGPVISSNSTVQIACRLTGFKVSNGNTWWYRIASTPGTAPTTPAQTPSTTTGRPAAASVAHPGSMNACAPAESASSAWAAPTRRCGPSGCHATDSHVHGPAGHEQ